MHEYLIEDKTRLYQAHGQKVRIQFYCDLDPLKPWDDDGAVPLVAYGGRRCGLHTEPARGYDLLHPWRHLSDSQIKRHLSEIVAACPAIGWRGVELYRDPATFDSFVREEYPGLTLREARREWLENYFGDAELSQSRLEVLAELWNLAGVPAAVKETRGYSQGDWAALLIVAHPDAVKSWGFHSIAAYRKACPNDLDGAANTYGAFAWGDVVGYVAEVIDSDEWEAEGLDPETVTASELNALRGCGESDSCWGFYPEDRDAWPFEKMYAYAIGEAESAAEGLAAEAAKRAAEEFAAEMVEARPDLAPQWEGARA